MKRTITIRIYHLMSNQSYTSKVFEYEDEESFKDGCDAQAESVNKASSGKMENVHFPLSDNTIAFIPAKILAESVITMTIYEGE